MLLIVVCEIKLTLVATPNTSMLVLGLLLRRVFKIRVTHDTNIKNLQGKGQNKISCAQPKKCHFTNE